MKIRYIAPSPKAGKTEHCRNDVGLTLIASGFAEAIPYKDFRERLQAEGQGGTDPHNVNPCVEGIQWGVKDASDSGFRIATVIKRSGAETTYFSALPPDAPKSIVARFNDLSNSTSAADNAADFEAAKRAQLEYDEKIKHVKRY
jgi:hypothetical protein